MTESSQSHQFTSLLENKFAGVILWDKNKILTHMNNNVEQLRSFQIGNCWYEIFEDILISEKIDQAIKQSHIKQNPELLNLLNEGKEIDPNDKQSVKIWAKRFGDIRLKTSGVPQESENPDGSWSNIIDLAFEDGSFITIFNDITNFKKNETESRKFRQAIDEMPYVIDLWDEEDKLIIANESSRSMWAKQGIRLEKGKDFKEFLEDAASVIPDLDIAAELNNRKLTIDQRVAEAYIPPPIDK